MKNFHQNLLIGLALCLCGLCVYQWTAQTQQRKQIEQQNLLLDNNAAAIQGFTNRIAQMDAQIAQMDKAISELKDTIKTNEAVQLNQRREISQLRVLNDSLTNDVAQYKDAVDKLEARLKEAYDGIRKQNDAIKQLGDQRNEFVQKLNDAVKDRNDVVNKYNDLVNKYNDLVKGAEKQSSK